LYSKNKRVLLDFQPIKELLLSILFHPLMSPFINPLPVL